MPDPVPTPNPLLSRDFDRLVPYTPGEQPRIADLLKLNTNENPYGPSPSVLEAIRGAADDSLRLYPDPGSNRLREAIGRRYGVGPDMVFVGNGSDEVLAHAFRAFFVQDRPLLLPDISYSFYPVYCAFFGIESVRIPLAGDFGIRLSDYERENGGIVFANPNAPTGIALPAAHIETLLQRNRDSVVLVDEAYVDFGGESAVGLVREHPNLLVVQTLSKSRALAGLRVGFAIGDPRLVTALETIKGSFNSYPIDRLAQAAALAAIEDEAWLERTCQQVIAARETLAAQLLELGFEVLPSATNFLFARHRAMAGIELFDGLRREGILVRRFDAARIEQFLRISIGTPAQCQRLRDTLAKLIAHAD
ncbi:MAG: histidinol-phosphate transaminase [Burkholderiaceae bacterium]